MNELLFILQIICIGSAVLIAFRFGKEALIALFCLQALIANLFILKQMRCFGLYVSCTDSYIIGCDFSLGLLQKHYGEKVAKKASILCLFFLLLFMALSYFHLLYVPCVFDKGHGIYKELFSSTPRIILSSLFVGYTAQKLNIFFQKKLQTYFPKAPLKIHLFAPIAFSQCYDTIAFSFLGLHGVVHSVGDIITMSMLIKLLAIIGMSSFAYLSKHFLPRPTV